MPNSTMRQNELRSFLSPYKIFYHADRLNSWLADGRCAPITVSLDLTLECNHRCPTCPYRAASCHELLTSWRNVKRVLDELASAGVRGVLFTGGGEPLVNPHARRAISYAHDLGMKVALITNGHSLNAETASVLVATCDWVRISVDAATPDLYAELHGVTVNAFDRVLANIQHLVQAKCNTQSGITVGIGMLTSCATIDQMVRFADLAETLQADYCQFRPLIAPTQEDVLAHREQFETQLALAREVVERGETQVIASPSKYSWVLDGSHALFTECFAPHFANVVGADGVMYLCPHLRYKSEYAIADLLSKSWLAQRYRALDCLLTNLPGSSCPALCKHAALNSFLQRVTNSRTHACFI
jgi:MoaA/NifB/PqqE/SkfB family radical SAM enzyme